jgi:dicarboxylate transporter 10
MQNDTKLAPSQRRNYKNVFEALYRIAKQEGFSRLYTGFHMATLRGVLVTIGQLAFYDEFKTRMIRTTYFSDNLATHFAASMGAGLIATLITMPADVVKTLLMNAKPGELKGIGHCVRDLLKRDKLGLFRGFWPRYIRLGPFTILTFVFYERLKVLVKDIHLY